MLTISYEKKTDTENKDYKTHRREFVSRSFKRSFSVDEKINADAIQAKYENGVLKLLLPKKEEVKVSPKQITIEKFDRRNSKNKSSWFWLCSPHFYAGFYFTVYFEKIFFTAIS